MPFLYGYAAGGHRRHPELQRLYQRTQLGLGVPDLSWTGTTYPKYLSWPAIPAAKAYKVYTCTTTNNDSLTACTPTGLPSTTTTPSYSPGDPGSRNTICVSVEATDGAVDSATSATKCIFQKNGSYSYQ